MNLFPFTNYHEINIDWILTKITDLEKKFGDEVKQTIREILATLFVNVTYDAANESIEFDLGVDDE